MPEAPQRPRRARARPHSTSRYEIALSSPFRLDLTANALRRLSTNAVDVFTPDGEYVRALGGFDTPAVVRVRQRRADRLEVLIESDAADHSEILLLVRSMLGIDVDLTGFERSARRIDWLAPLVQRMRGLKPPRYPSLWETCVNTVVFQQVSLQAASSITRKLVLALGMSMESSGVPLFLFPGMESFQRADDDLLRSVGLSAGKLSTLRRVGDALTSGGLDVERLTATPSPEAARMLREIKGIGPWTAAIMLLRGLGRLDVFPPNDSSVAANLALIGGPAPHAAGPTLDALGSQRGMLYFFLLLARLEARGEIEGTPP